MGKIEFRPGRIQSLSPEEEIVYKQVWGYLLRYWGYDLNFPVADLAWKQAFVASSINVENKTIIDDAILVANGATEAVQQQPRKKSWGTWVRGGDEEAMGSGEVPQTKRIQRVQSKKEEKYKPIKISDQHRYTYLMFYDQGNELNRNYELDDSNSTLTSPFSSISGTESIESQVSNITLDNDTKVDLSAATSIPKTLSDGTEVHCKPKKSILPLFTKYQPNELHRAFWKMQRGDLLDNWVLKFIRARNFDVERGLNMFTTDLDWKSNECQAYEWLLEGDSISYLRGINPGFVKNFTVSKAWIKGHDRKNNIVFVFRAKLHMIADGNPQDEMKRWCVLMIEWCRFYMKDIKASSDQSTVVFDLTGFSLKNADYTTIKFIADVFEAHYPECLEKIFIYNAPWIFQTMWNIIKGWFDPVVASKITFVNTIEEIGEFIDPEQLSTMMGGEDSYEGEYPVPTKADSLTKPKDGKFQQLIKERDELNLQFLERTARWIESYDSKTSSKYLEDKINVSIKLAKNYCELDPYIRRKGLPDRMKEGRLNVSLDSWC